MPDGYDIGRWATVGDRNEQVIVLLSFSNNLVAAAVGETSYDGVKYSTTAKNISGLLAPGDNGINHGQHATLVVYK